MPKFKDMFLNYFPIGQIPLLKKIHTTKFREMFSPEEREERYQEYRDSANLGSGLTSTDVFKKYIDNHTDSLDKLSAVKMDGETSNPIQIGGKTIAARLNESLEESVANPQSRAALAVPVVKNAFATALELTDATKEARENFDADVKALNAIIRKDPPQFSPNAIASRVQEIRTNATQALEQQQATEKTRVTALFEGPTSADIKLGMKLNEEQFASFKTDTLSTLEKKHKDEKAELDNALHDETTKLHKLAQTERDRISFLAALYQNSEFMKEMIDKLHQKEVERRRAAGESDEEITLAMGSPEWIQTIGNNALKNIGVGDLSQIRTETGLKITVGKDAQDNISLSVELPNVYNKERYLATMTCLAMACRAAGHEHCTMTIEHKDEEKAMQAARLAFEGAVIAGYDPGKNISIVVNGKTKQLGELFPNNKEGGKNTKLTAIEALYQKNQAKTQGYEQKAPTVQEAAKLKEALQAERQKQYEIDHPTTPDSLNPSSITPNGR